MSSLGILGLEDMMLQVIDIKKSGWIQEKLQV
jgi:hypothetical protein